MKQKNLALILILIFTSTVIIFSCSKGPAGATGATGAAGPQGPAGPTGSTGATGTANVIYSPWLTVTYGPLGDTTMIANIPVPKLSDSIINFGDVKVYINLGSDAPGGALVSPLPLNDPFFFTDTSSSPITLIINPYYYADTIVLVSNYDVSTQASGGYNYYQYRYILIPGGTSTLPATINGTKKPINWNDYNEVKAYLGLKD